MGFEELVIDLVMQATSKLTLNQLTALVQNHPEYKGTSKGQALRRRIERVLEAEREHESAAYIKLKLGRFEGKIDFS